MVIPQIILAGLILLGLGVEMERHGKPKKGKENFWITLSSSAIIAGLLWWGGFWG